MKKVFVVLSAFISLFWISSCDIGLGELVDLEAPEIAVTRMVVDGSETTSFGTTLYTKKKVTFHGTCFDNVAIDKVYAQVKWVGDEDYKFLSNAFVSGGEWRLSVDFPREGACWLKIVCEDKKGNYGTKSAKVVTLFVDENAPSGEAWYIDRLVSGIQYSLQTKEALEAIVAKDPTLSQPSNIDVAQNGQFKICSSFSDASGIKSVKISIWEGNSKIADVTQDTGTSNYAPQFTIDRDKYSGLPEGGLHYLQVKYTAEDIVTDPGANSVEDAEFDMGYFIWWPESDNPRYYIAQADDRGDLSLHIGDSVNVTVFDDDGFTGGNKIKCVLKSGGSAVGTFEHVAADGERECNIIVKAPTEAQTLTMTVTAKDMKDKSLDKTCNVLVTDDNHPTLIITTPENNQIPSVSGDCSEISFSGITLDASGCTYLKFIWIPDSVSDKETKAQDWLKDHTSTVPSSDADVIDGPDGMKLYNVKLSAAVNEGGLKKQTFDFKTYLTCTENNPSGTHAKHNSFGDDKTKDKYFYIRLIRKDGNYTDSELKLAADNIKPELKLLNPAGNMAIIDKDESLTLKFRSEKSSGLAIDTSKYKIEYIAPDGTPTLVTGSYDSTNKYYYSNTISASDLSNFNSNNINPKYRFTAEDILGNKNEATYQFIISAMPQISSVSSSAPAKCKAGDDILINVSFTKPVACTSDAKLKITNISNAAKSQAATEVLYANYESGSGSTTLVFKYTVQEGDESVQLQVINTSGYGPIKDKDTVSGHLTFLTDANNLQAKKTIKIDGVKPKINDISVSSDAVTENTFGGNTYLKEGRTLTATVKVDKKVTIQGSPSFNLNVGASTVALNWQSISYSGTKSSIVFSKKILATDVNGSVSYNKADCLKGASNIKDDFGNSLASSLTGSGTEKFVIDTMKPGKPVVWNKAENKVLASGKYKEKVQFVVSNVNQAHTVTEYSTDGGTNWTDYADWTDKTGWTAPEKIELTAAAAVVNANLVVRITDRAGNVSDYSDPLSLEINNTFPEYTVECTKGDGNYKAGTVLEFKVSFAEPVDVSSSSTAYIDLSGIGASDAFGSPLPRAEIVSTQKGKKDLSEVLFRYTVVQGDTFTLKVDKGAVNLAGIKDKYGVEQNGKAISGNADYKRPNLCCDTVPPKVVKMTPGGTKTPLTGKNIYTSGKTIELEFSEPVKAVSGKIYLRQTKGWAIPPMFTASDFNKVLTAVKSAGNNKPAGHSLTGTEILYMDGLEDAEWLYSSSVGPANDRYHGTAQFVGPYKKSSQGLDANNNPDYKNTKYVLDYDVEIWGDNDSAKTKFGLTFPTGQGDISADNYPKNVQTGKVKFRDLSSKPSITTKDIRDVLESIHFHERYMNVNSASVVINGNKVSITVPNGFLGDDDLLPGREWELVIEKGAFMDETGNYFGYEADGTKSMSDSQQATNGSSTLSSTWARKRTSVAASADIKPLVLIQDGANASFLSSGVAKPVIRVDRYSYGLGIHQPKMNGTAIDNSSYVKVDSTGDKGITEPTARVRVRIDCETKGAKIKYGENHASKSKSDATTQAHTDASNIDNDNNKKSVSKKSTTAVTLPTTQNTGDAEKIEFLSGSGDYKKSYRQLISAKASFNDVDSEVEKEGVFQTVLNINDPKYNNGSDSISAAGNGYHFLSVRGTTGFAGEPSISPFPLRDSPVGSCYLRQTYKDGNQYYWISYEILIDSSVSFYAYGKNWENKRLNDWACNWGLISWGEYSDVSMLRSWIGKN